MRTGFVSISLRRHSVAEIVTLTANAGLECIEWGGDIHVPPGNTAAAKEAAQRTRDAGLAVSAYGSYLRLGAGGDAGAVVEAAQALGAPTIRVWAGSKGSHDATPGERRWVADAALAFADLAQGAGMTVSYEFHGGTLTDTAESASEFFQATRHPAIRSFWQPPVGLSQAQALDSLEVVLPILSNVHAFHWEPTSSDRHPLAAGATRWSAYLNRIRWAGKNPDVLLEFLPGDDASLLAGEAATLRELIGKQPG